MGLQAAYANLHTDQERDYFMQRYHEVISSVGGKTSYDADNRPLLVMRSNLWASGYDVDGTEHTSLGQFSGRVQQTYKHSVPRFFVPEHGTMFTLALFFFQAEDGIRDPLVTGVQTCALPISPASDAAARTPARTDSSTGRSARNRTVLRAARAMRAHLRRETRRIARARRA